MGGGQIEIIEIEDKNVFNVKKLKIKLKISKIGPYILIINQ